MKKSVMIALASLAIGAASTSVSAQEVTFVEDCSQGTLLNKNKDNWFLTVEGGSNVLFGKHDIKADLKDRFGANAALYVGKWLTPNFGFRFGANWIMPKGATTANGMYRKANASAFSNGYYPEKFMGLGPEFDVMVNLTNWWCGYRPGRVYNAVVHGGAGAYFTASRSYEMKNGKSELSWVNAHNAIMFANVGLQNNFAVSKHVDLFLDVQYEIIDFSALTHDVSASIGLNINFGKTDWNCPVTAICPTWKYTDAEGDALVARLNQAENKIKNLQQQLDACLARPAQKQVINCEGLATVYYPINQSSLSSREKTILKSVAQVMIENPNQKYVLTGWADNYTGTEEINTRLRNARVDGVKNYLVSCGVPESQLDARIDASNLTDFGVKGAPLDRAVTIKLAD
ncbi:MAG: OmpA family protein [Bacteroidales bacterium]|nr:OmpA family protein [Bacteroidales bacterium]